jgi:glycerophosphoryl diester phosphodiesterase
MGNRSFTTALEQVSPARRLRGSTSLDTDVFIRPIAHRGLHDPSQGRLENTAPAFMAAIDKGYGIECDLQSAADGTPMVFHDDKLDRLVAASGPIAAYTPAKLARFSYRGFDQKILTFTQFLELVGGRVPLLVEVKGKASAHDPAFLHEIAELASAYRGPIALMSFNRALVATLADLAPKIPRGAVVGGQQVLASLWSSRGRLRDSAAGARVFRPNTGGLAFYAVDVKLVAVARRWMTRHGIDLPLFSWTIRTPRQRAIAGRWADAPIFEGYEP